MNEKTHCGGCGGCVKSPTPFTDPWAPSSADYDRSIHQNPDAKAWADLFITTFPGLADKHDLMTGWFANAMMAMHDWMKSKEQEPHDKAYSLNIPEGTTHICPKGHCYQIAPHEDQQDGTWGIWVVTDGHGSWVTTEASGVVFDTLVALQPIPTGHKHQMVKRIEDEMSRQVAKWGQQNWPSNTWPNVLDSALPLSEANGDYFKFWCDTKANKGNLSWLDIFLEEVFEAVDEARKGNLDNLKTELIQIAAVAASWAESIERNNH